MTKVYEQDAIWTVANQLLECAAGQLAETPSGAPDRQCVVYGSELIWDECDCGLLAVHVPQIFFSETFPNIRLASSNCNSPFVVAEYVVSILRCVPQPDANGNPPDCPKVSAAAHIDFTDRWAVWRGVACCLGSRLHLVQQQLAIGEAGACAGSQLHVLVASSNCVDC